MNVAPGAWRYALLPLLAAPFALFYSVLVSIVALAIGVAVLAFFRDPDRTPPPTGVVAAADGSVSVLREEGPERAVRLGVFMNVWNVHVIRAPFDGTVTAVTHSPGAHKPAFSKESDRNEKVHVRIDTDAFDSISRDEAETTDAGGSVAGTGDDVDNHGGSGVEPPAAAGVGVASGEEAGDAVGEEAGDAVGEEAGDAVGEEAGDAGDPTVAHSERETADGSVAEVTLIAGAFARRIHPYVEPGESVERGQRIGHIAFGSRVDVLFPPTVDRNAVTVEPGERVVAGETVVLESAEDDLLGIGLEANREDTTRSDHIE